MRDHPLVSRQAAKPVSSPGTHASSLLLHVAPPGGWSRLPGLLLGALLATLPFPALAQISPGPLAAAHQDLDSPMKCLSCHGKGEKGAMRGRCLECHKEIAWLEERKLGLHGSEDKGNCAGCHPDHAGRKFAMIRWEEGSAEQFRHQRAGWLLEGKHANTACRDCHKAPFASSEVVHLARKKDREGSYLGLEKTCLPCHRVNDVHRGSLGRGCEKCHDTRTFKPASHFDHAKSEFPLTGRHARVGCEKCHRAAAVQPALNREGKPVPVFKPVSHAECSACHQDPHGARLGPTCSRCHVTDTWKSVDRKVFDHDRTRYPLRGRHAAVPCAGCHDPVTAWGKRPAFASCGTCHKDPHAGRATLAGKMVDCAACHREDGFRPSTLPVAQHAVSGFPLLGKHAAVKCESCHRKNPAGVPAESLGKAGVLIRMGHDRCRSCHEDSHGGQLAARPDRGACESCHKVDGWKPTTFGAAQHAKLRLSLEGRHGKISCSACHGPARTGLPPLPGTEKIGKAGVLLSLKETACVSCHQDPHEGRFSPKGQRPKPAGCIACHGPDSFRPSRVDVAAHRDFAYPLEGAHRAIPCNACHAESGAPALKSSLVLARDQSRRMPFTTRGSRCENCHKNPHGLQFARRKEGGACRSCHGEEAFRPASRFDHNRDAGFSLEGAHARVACGRCHVPRTVSPGQALVLYQGISRECRSCHVGRQPGKLTGASAPGSMRQEVKEEPS